MRSCGARADLAIDFWTAEVGVRIIELLNNWDGITIMTTHIIIPFYEDFNVLLCIVYHIYVF